MKIRGVASSEAIDSSSEILKLSGCDISSIADGTAYLNFEHEGHKDQGENIVGKMTYAKKIYTAQDCDTEIQLKFLKQLSNIPYLYFEGDLFPNHPGAVCIEAIMRYSKARGIPMEIGTSVEGAKVENEGNVLTRTLIRGLAITIKPCNKQAFAQLMDDMPEVRKALGSEGYTGLRKGGTVSLEDALEEDPESDIKVLAKALSAGVGMGAAGNKVQGGSLSKADRKLFKRVISNIIRDSWDRKTPIEKFLKSRLSPLGPKFTQHFKDVADEIRPGALAPILTRRDLVTHIQKSQECGDVIGGLHKKLLEKAQPKVSGVNAKGQKVILRRAELSDNDTMLSSERAAVYSRLAKNYFGVPAPHVAVIADSKTHRVYHAEPLVEGMSGFQGEEYDNSLRSLSSDSQLAKILVTDYVLGHGNRHMGNLLLPNGGDLTPVSNDHAFSAPSRPELLDILNDEQKTVSSATRYWLESLQDKNLAHMALMAGLPKQNLPEVQQRMQVVMQRMVPGSNLESLYDS